MRSKPFSMLSIDTKKERTTIVFVIPILAGCFASFLTVLAAEPEKTEASPQVFETEHVWDAKVTIADGILLGKSKRGWRRIVPITGGSFEGPNIRGEEYPAVKIGNSLGPMETLNSMRDTS